MSDGMKEKIRDFLQQKLGIKKQQEEIDQLYYFLNHLTDISQIRLLHNEDLQQIQEGCLEMLGIFHALCEKYGLTYWLDYGTLLGARRHNGFIPWDDDMDVGMVREEYDKVIPLMQEEMKQYGIDVRWGGHFDDMGPMERLAFGYKTLETGVWMDIFPVDHIPCNRKADDVRDDLLACQRQYSHYYRKKHPVMPDERMKEEKKKFLASFAPGEHELYFHGAEFPGNNDIVLEKEEIFPPVLHSFGAYEFYVPRNMDKYLEQMYGRDYMSFPKQGAEHHLDPDGGTVSERPRRSGTDMEEVKAYLRQVKAKIR